MWPNSPTYVAGGGTSVVDVIFFLAWAVPFPMEATNQVSRNGGNASSLCNNPMTVFNSRRSKWQSERSSSRPISDHFWLAIIYIIIALQRLAAQTPLESHLEMSNRKINMMHGSVAWIVARSIDMRMYTLEKLPKDPKAKGWDLLQPTDPPMLGWCRKLPKWPGHSSPISLLIVCSTIH